MTNAPPGGLGWRSACLLAVLACLVAAPLHAGEGGLRVALLQMAPTGEGLDAQRDKAIAFCRRAAAQGADIALMPEMWDAGYPTPGPLGQRDRERFAEAAHAPDSPWLLAFAALARELEMAIAVTYLQAWEGAPRNALTLFDRRGEAVLTYAKVHTCDWNPLEAATTPGEDFPVAELDTRHGPVMVGAMICYDREHPEAARILMLNGAEIVLVPNASGLNDMRLDQFKVRAYENCFGVAMANYAEPKNNGRSVAYDQRGRELVRARGREGVHIAEFDLAALREERAKTIWGDSFRRPHRYDAITRMDQAPIWQRRSWSGGPYTPRER